MGEVVNLRRVRKRKSRQTDEAEAAANRILHGVPKREYLAAKAETGLERGALDSHRLDPKIRD